MVAAIFETAGALLAAGQTGLSVAFEHIGMYAYRKEFLLKYAVLPQTPLEKLESLEQLRVLEHGFRLRVVETRQDYIPLSVDTQEDLERARILARKNA